MKRIILALSFAALWPATATWAQLYPPNEAGVSVAQIHTLVRDVDATKKFWILLGGKPIRIDGTDVMKFPGVFIFMQRGTPSGPSNGTSVDHIGFWQQDPKGLIPKLIAEHVNMDPQTPTVGVGYGYVYTPDYVKVDVVGRGTPATPDMQHSPATAQMLNTFLKTSQGAFDHIHFLWPVPMEAQAWYGKMFGAQDPYPTESNLRGGPNFPDGRAFTILAGVRLAQGRTVTAPATGVVPTRGRALDYIGFEVKNLEAFCKKLESQGVKFDHPYSKSRHKSFANADLTDPWGASIELTEGLNRF